MIDNMLPNSLVLGIKSHRNDWYFNFEIAEIMGKRRKYV